MVVFKANGYWVSEGFRIRWQLNTANNSRCGDGLLDYLSEDCDDGNSDGGDGCSNCTVEAGWRCPDGAACERVCAYTLAEGFGENLGFWDPSNDYADNMLCTWLIAPSAGSNNNITVRTCPTVLPLIGCTCNPSLRVRLLFGFRALHQTKPHC